jgi:hypothetical protein
MEVDILLSHKGLYIQGGCLENALCLGLSYTWAYSLTHGTCKILSMSHGTRVSDPWRNKT